MCTYDACVSFSRDSTPNRFGEFSSVIHTRFLRVRPVRYVARYVSVGFPFSFLFPESKWFATIYLCVYKYRFLLLIDLDSVYICILRIIFNNVRPSWFANFPSNRVPWQPHRERNKFVAIQFWYVVWTLVPWHRYIGKNTLFSVVYKRRRILEYTIQTDNENSRSIVYFWKVSTWSFVFVSILQPITSNFRLKEYSLKSGYNVKSRVFR